MNKAVFIVLFLASCSAAGRSATLDVYATSRRPNLLPWCARGRQTQARCIRVGVQQTAWASSHARATMIDSDRATPSSALYIMRQGPPFSNLCNGFGRPRATTNTPLAGIKKNFALLRQDSAFFLLKPTPARIGVQSYKRQTACLCACTGQTGLPRAGKRFPDVRYANWVQGYAQNLTLPSRCRRTSRRPLGNRAFIAGHGP